MSRSKLYIKYVLVILLTSCGNDQCVNSNRDLDRLSPETREYNVALASEIRIRENVHYIIDGFEMQDNSPTLFIKVLAEDLCGKLRLAILRPDPIISPVLEKKAVSYNGAEIENLQMIPNNAMTGYIYITADKIID